MATSTFTAGQRLTANFMRLAYPMGVIAEGIRTSTKATADNTTEVGVLRVDGVALLGGRAYQIVTSNLRASSTSGTHWVSKIRWTDTGVAATTSSAELARSEGSTTTDSYGAIVANARPSSDVTGSFLLTLQRTSGTTVVTLQNDGAGIFLTVIDLGIAVADTGVDI